MSPFTIVFCFAVGLPQLIWPHQLARFSEQLDSIGSKRRWSQVEPANWKVTLTRGIGVVLTVLGVYGIVAG